MKLIPISFILILPLIVLGQSQTPKDFGFRHLQMNYKGDKVDILVKSKKGEENIPKPIFLFLQGSTSKPLIITENGENYRVFPFYTDSIVSKYHLVIIGRPYIPVIFEKDKLDGFEYVDTITKKYDKRYVERNILDYYVERNKKVLDYLLKQKWVDNNRLFIQEEIHLVDFLISFNKYEKRKLKTQLLILKEPLIIGVRLLKNQIEWIIPKEIHISVHLIILSHP
jgi:hypothetical protein